MEYLGARLLCSFFSGVIMSQSGSFIQLATRNLLASPSTLGLDGLAVLWVLVLHSASILISNGISGPLMVLSGIPIFTLLGLLYSRMLKRALNFERVVLLGVTFNLLIGAVFSFWQFLFMAFNLPFPVELWFGHFRFADWASAFVLMTIAAAILGFLFFYWKEVLLYSLGPSIARNFRLKQRALFSFLFMAVAVGTLTVVGLFGAFSFLGLVLPILSRRLWFRKFDLKGELFIGAMVNGAVLMLMDLLCYQFPVWGAEVPVGVIVTGVGAVSLIMLLWKTESRVSLVKLEK
jgi:iron complex transport system permease protein